MLWMRNYGYLCLEIYPISFDYDCYYGCFCGLLVFVFVGLDLLVIIVILCSFFVGWNFVILWYYSLLLEITYVILNDYIISIYHPSISNQISIYIFYYFNSYYSH